MREELVLPRRLRQMFFSVGLALFLLCGLISPAFSLDLKNIDLVNYLPRNTYLVIGAKRPDYSKGGDCFVINGYVGYIPALIFNQLPSGVRERALCSLIDTSIVEHVVGYVRKGISKTETRPSCHFILLEEPASKRLKKLIKEESFKSSSIAETLVYQVRKGQKTCYISVVQNRLLVVSEDYDIHRSALQKLSKERRELDLPLLKPMWSKVDVISQPDYFVVRHYFKPGIERLPSKDGFFMPDRVKKDREAIGAVFVLKCNKTPISKLFYFTKNGSGPRECFGYFLRDVKENTKLSRVSEDCWVYDFDFPAQSKISRYKGVPFYRGISQILFRR